MNIIDNLVSEIINNYKLVLVVIGVLITVRIFIEYRKKNTTEYKCPYCQTNATERVSRGFFIKLIQLNNVAKKFKCLKCRKVYYVRETSKQPV